MDKLKGYRTYIVAALIILWAIADAAGVKMPEAPPNGELAGAGVLMALLRTITSTSSRQAS